MPKTPELNAKTDSRRLAAIDQMLLAAIKQGPAKKRQAINRILEPSRDGLVGTVASVSDTCGTPPNLRFNGQPNWKKNPGQMGPVRTAMQAPC